MSQGKYKDYKDIIAILKDNLNDAEKVTAENHELGYLDIVIMKRRLEHMENEVEHYFKHQILDEGQCSVCDNTGEMLPEEIL